VEQLVSSTIIDHHGSSNVINHEEIKTNQNNKPSQQLPETACPESKIRCWVPFCSMEVLSILIGWLMKDFKHETTTLTLNPEDIPTFWIPLALAED
jgi:hypothetical protein